MGVNNYLKDLREDNNFPFISNTTINAKKHFQNQQSITLERKRLQQTL